MFTSYSITTTQTAKLAGLDGEATPERSDLRRDVRAYIPSGHRVLVELTNRQVEFHLAKTDADGLIDLQSDERESLTVSLYSGSGDEIASAVADYIARMHSSLTSTYFSEDEKTQAREKLARFAGEMGLDYLATLQGPLLPGETR